MNIRPTLTRSNSAPNVLRSPNPNTTPTKLSNQFGDKPGDVNLPSPSPIGITPRGKAAVPGPAPHVTVQQVVHNHAQQNHNMNRVAASLAHMPSYKPTLMDDVEQHEFQRRLLELDLGMAVRSGDLVEQDAVKLALERIHLNIESATQAVLTDLSSRYNNPATADPKQLDSDLAQLRRIRSSLNADEKGAEAYHLGATPSTTHPSGFTPSPVAQRYGQLKQSVGVEVARLAGMQSQIIQEAARTRNIPKPPITPPAAPSRAPNSAALNTTDLTNLTNARIRLKPTVTHERTVQKHNLEAEKFDQEMAEEARKRNIPKPPPFLKPIPPRREPNSKALTQADLLRGRFNINRDVDNEAGRNIEPATDSVTDLDKLDDDLRAVYQPEAAQSVIWSGIKMDGDDVAQSEDDPPTVISDSPPPLQVAMTDVNHEELTTVDAREDEPGPLTVASDSEQLQVAMTDISEDIRVSEDPPQLQPVLIHSVEEEPIPTDPDKKAKDLLAKGQEELSGMSPAALDDFLVNVAGYQRDMVELMSAAEKKEYAERTVGMKAVGAVLS